MGAEDAAPLNPGPPQSPLAARLLPWSGAEGKPCYLISDSHGGSVSRLADATESIQLGMGADLLAHAVPCSRTPRGANSASSPSV